MFDLSPEAFKIASDLHDYLAGTGHDLFQVVDQFIEDGDIDEKIWRDNELKIVEYVENFIFNCSVCGWWFDNCDKSDIEDENVCKGCEDDY